MKSDLRVIGLSLIAALACMLVALVLLPNTKSFAQGKIVIAQSTITEKEAYDAAKELGTIEAWEAFLNTYSTGFRADLARAYLKRIASEAPKQTPAVTTPPPPPPSPPVETVVAPPPPPPLPADISLAMTSQGACSGGQSCSYTVTATNAGGELFSGALTIATSVAPGGGQLQGTGTPPYSCQDMGGGAVCSHGAVNLGPGQSATIPMTFTLPRNAGGQVTACASIAWGGVPAILGPIEVQRKLNELGFNAGAVDGQPGRQTVKAIRAYQASAGLQQTGAIDLPLLLSLFAPGGAGDANPANDQACAGAAVIAAPVAFTPTPRPQVQYCADGRLRQGGGCVCPSSVPVWTGKTCVPRKVRNCTGGRYYSKKRKLCLCPSRKPHWYNNRCYAGVDDCPGDSSRVGNQCIKQDEPAIQAGGPQVTGCPANTIRIGNSCVQINLAPLFNIGKKPKGGSQTFTGGGNRPNRPQGGATVAQPGGAQGVQGGGSPSMSGGRCPQPSMIIQNGKCKCIGGSVRGVCITAFNVKTFACKDLPPVGAWKEYRPDCVGPAKTGGGQPTFTNKPSGGGGLKCAAGTKNIGGKCLSQQQINAALASRQCRTGNFAAFIPGGVVDCKPCSMLWAIKKGSWPYKAGSCQGGVKKPVPPPVVKQTNQQPTVQNNTLKCRQGFALQMVGNFGGKAACVPSSKVKLTCPAGQIVRRYSSGLEKCVSIGTTKPPPGVNCPRGSVWMSHLCKTCASMGHPTAADGGCQWGKKFKKTSSQVAPPIVKQTNQQPVVKKMTRAQAHSQLLNHCRGLGGSNAICSKYASNKANAIANSPDPAKALAKDKAEISAWTKANQQKPPTAVKKMSKEQVRSQLFSHCMGLGASNAECSKSATGIANNIFAKGLDPAKGLSQGKAHLSFLANQAKQKPVQKQIICKAGTGLIVQNGNCACPGNKRWNGKVCAATGIKCAPDQKPAGNRCVPRCGIGTRWNGKTCIKDQSKTQTKEIICSSNLVPVNGQCKCPPGLTWNGKVCAGPQKLQAKPRPVINICQGGAQKVGNTCRCPGGQAPQVVGTDSTGIQIKQLYQCPSQQQPQQANCRGGQVPNGQGGCACPANKPRWNGSYCKKAKKSSTDKVNKFLKQLQQPQPQNQPQQQNRPQQQNQNQLTPQQQQQIQKGLNDLGKLLSDERLKRDIAHVATHDDGLELYSFRYLWLDEAYVGVMAQDLLADPAKRDAVSLHPSGYYMVDYDKLGLHMVTLEEWQAGH
jgi:hypothetical protein